MIKQNIKKLSKYIIGNKDKIIYIENPIFSKYLPNLSYDIILELNNLNDDLYLICVQYDILDIQFGISETSLIGETPIDNAYRGIREELQIELNKDLFLYGVFEVINEYKHYHYMCNITDNKNYTYNDTKNISTKKYDNKNQKSSIYLYGKKNILIPILKNYNKNNSNDKIKNIVLSPFKCLKQWLNFSKKQVSINYKNSPYILDKNLHIKNIIINTERYQKIDSYIQIYEDKKSSPKKSKSKNIYDILSDLD